MSFSIICLSSNISTRQMKKKYSGTSKIVDSGKKYINTVSIPFISFFHEVYDKYFVLRLL